MYTMTAIMIPSPTAISAIITDMIIGPVHVSLEESYPLSAHNYVIEIRCNLKCIIIIVIMSNIMLIQSYIYRLQLLDSLLSALICLLPPPPLPPQQRPAPETRMLLQTPAHQSHQKWQWLGRYSSSLHLVSCWIQIFCCRSLCSSYISLSHK